MEDNILDEQIEDIVSGLAWNGTYEDAGQRVVSELETERAKRQIQALVEKQVLIGRKAELTKAEFVIELRTYILYKGYLLNRVAELDRKISELKG